MPRVHDPSLWNAARRMVVEDGSTYDQVVERTGISLSAVQKRAAEEGWKDQRDRFVSSAAEYKQKVTLLKGRYLDKALESGDPQDVHAWQAIEKAYPEHRYGALGEAERRALVAAFIEAQVSYLASTVPDLLGELQGHIRPMVEHILSADWRV